MSRKKTFAELEQQERDDRERYAREQEQAVKDANKLVEALLPVVDLFELMERVAKLERAARS